MMASIIIFRGIYKLILRIYLINDMKTVIKVDNIMCSGCFNSARREIGTLHGVFSVDMDLINRSICIEHTDEVDQKMLAEKFIEMGYSEDGVVDGFLSFKAGPSYSGSCARTDFSEE